jgi:hypothetical protein
VQESGVLQCAGRSRPSGPTSPAFDLIGFSDTT